MNQIKQQLIEEKREYKSQKETGKYELTHQNKILN